MSDDASASGSGSPGSIAYSDLHPASDQDDGDYIEDDDDAAPDGADPESDIADPLDDESDFDPDESEDDAPKPKGKTKAKAARQTRSSAPTKRITPTTIPKINWTIPEGAKRSTELALEASELMAYPIVYRDYLIAASSNIARIPVEKGPSGGLKLSVFPIGPVTPFTTHLVERYDGTSAKVMVVRDSENALEREKTRRDEMRETAKKVSALVPWDLWLGEAWYREMYEEKEMDMDSDDETKLPPGWTWRSEVRLGLEEVGRGMPDIISSSVGEKYLPHGKTVKVLMGAGGSQTREQIAPFTSVPFDTPSETSSGIVFNVGGPVWGLDWCPYPESLALADGGLQYLAISATDNEPAIGSRAPFDARGAIQLWSINGDGTSARCELVLCIEGGAAHDIKWIPLGGWDDNGDSPKLGIISAVQEDGTVSLYAVPRPATLHRIGDKPVYIRAAPVMKLSIPDAACTCIDWLSGLRIVVGLSNGFIAVWDLDGLPNGDYGSPLPSLYFSATISPICAIAAGRCPPTKATGEYDYSGDATFVSFSSWDGAVGMTDLRDPGTALDLNRARLPSMAMAWSPQLATPVYADVDYMVTIAQIRLTGSYNFLVSPHRGPIWDIATSDYHTMIASCSADGALIVANCGMGFYRRKNGGLLYQRLYELDWDEHTDEYRMTDSFMPEACSLEEALKHSKKKGIVKSGEHQQAPTDGDVSAVKTAAWSRNVGIHKVSWQTGAGIGQAGWLASGGRSGLVRVENLG